MRRGTVSALLPLTALLGVAVQAQDHKPSFEVASVKENRTGVMRLDGRLVPGGRWGFRPGGYAAENAILKNIIMEAYEIRQQVLLAGGGGWIESARFDIEAKAPDSPDKHQVNIMLQSLLEERFKLTVHRERKEIPVYFLVTAKAGFKESKIAGRPTRRCTALAAADPLTGSPTIWRFCSAVR